MEKTWRATWAGILAIIAGCIGIGIGAFVTVMGGTIGALAGLGGMLTALGAAPIGLGIVALIGGIVTLRRKAWGFALTGAILACFCFLPLGILAIIFVSMGRREFA